MTFRTVFTALFIVLISVLPAEAGPIAGAVAAIGSILKAGGLAALLIKTVASVALSYGVGLIKQAQARRAAKKNQRNGVSFQVQMGDTQPMSYLLGTRATAGKRKYIGSWGKAHDTPNAYITDVVELSCLPSRNGPQGLDAAWCGEKKCTILWAEPHPDGRGYPVQEFRKGSADFLWIKYLDGTQTVADPFLVATFGAHPDRPWKATMVGRGLQLAIMTARLDKDLFKAGLPQMLYQPKPMKLYDLRLDSTNGGAGAHRWSDPSTWASSDNLALMTYYVARGVYYDGEWVHGGRNFAQHRLPASSWMAAANEADRNMGSGRKQFRGGLEIFVDEEPLDTIEDFRVGCAGRLAEVGGVIKLLVGAPAAAVYAFSDAGVVVTSDQDFEPFPSIASTHNTLTAVYPEPEQRWADKDAPERSVAELVARDGGQKLSTQMRFEAVPFSAQVQSLMKTMLDEEQRWRIHELVLPPEAGALEPNDVVSWTSDRQYYSNKKFILLRSTRLRGRLYRVLLKELDPTDYDPPAIIVPPVIGYIGDTSTPVQLMDGWTAEPATVKDSAGVDRRPAIRIGCQEGLTDVRAVWVQVRVKATGAVVFDSQDTPYASPTSWLISGAWTLPSTLYQARGRFVPESNRRTDWGDWLDVLTGNVRLGSEDVYLPGLVEDIGKTIDDATQWLREGSRELINTAMRTAMAVVNQDAANFTDKQSLRQELVSRAGQLTAAYRSEIVVATGPGSAISRRVDTVEATIPSLATVSALDALTATVTSQAGTIAAYGARLSSIESTLPGKAEASAVSLLTTRVTDVEGTVTAQADSLTSLFAALGGGSAAVNVRASVQATPAGYAARYGIEARTGGAGSYRSASMYLDVPSSASSPTRVVIVADQFVIASGSNLENPFVFSGGVARLNVANIGTVNAGRLQSLNGKMDINLNNGTIEIYS